MEGQVDMLRRRRKGRIDNDRIFEMKMIIVVLTLVATVLRLG